MSTHTLSLEASRPLWLATPAAVRRSRTPSGLPGRDRTWSDVVGHCPEWSAGGRTLSEVAGACPDAVRSLESGRMGSEREYFVLRLLTQPRSCGVRGELHRAPKAGALRFCSVAHSAFPVREL